MAPGRISLSVANARDLAEGALRGIGYHDDEARIIADHVIDAALCGYEYSGLAKILNIPESEHFKLQRRPMKVTPIWMPAVMRVRDARWGLKRC
jgi:LDH2 family malate/lactate/ureidoglycolate dehydrogenase